jgi:mRNA-degrading endonuclease RelE of RelBE toxin-antitoxin system
MDDSPYTIVYDHQVSRFLDHLEVSQPKTFQRIEDDIRHLAFTKSSAKLKALAGKYKGLLRLRIGRDYRAMLYFDHAVGQLYVVAIEHRKDVYRP